MAYESYPDHIKVNNPPDTLIHIHYAQGDFVDGTVISIGEILQWCREHNLNVDYCGGWFLNKNTWVRTFLIPDADTRIIFSLRWVE